MGFIQSHILNIHVLIMDYITTTNVFPFIYIFFYGLSKLQNNLKK